MKSPSDLTNLVLNCSLNRHYGQKPNVNVVHLVNNLLSFKKPTCPKGQ